jgi:hypothetical protein
VDELTPDEYREFRQSLDEFFALRSDLRTALVQIESDAKAEVRRRFTW